MGMYPLEGVFPFDWASGVGRWRRRRKQKYSDREGKKYFSYSTASTNFHHDYSFSTVVILHLTHRALIFCESKGRLSFQDVCLYLCNVIQHFNIRDAAEQVAKNSHHRKYRVELMVFTRLILISFCSPAKQAKHTSWSPCRLDLLPPVIKDLMWVYAQGRRFLSAVEENLTS